MSWRELCFLCSLLFNVLLFLLFIISKSLARRTLQQPVQALFTGMFPCCFWFAHVLFLVRFLLVYARKEFIHRVHSRAQKGLPATNFGAFRCLLWIIVFRAFIHATAHVVFLRCPRVWIIGGRLEQEGAETAEPSPGRELCFLCSLLFKFLFRIIFKSLARRILR